jgi:hypothetical protein
VADYNNVRKDKCAKEFLKLQQCYTVRKDTPIFQALLTDVQAAYKKG